MCRVSGDTHGQVSMAASLLSDDEAVCRFPQPRVPVPLLDGAALEANTGDA